MRHVFHRSVYLALSFAALAGTARAQSAPDSNSVSDGNALPESVIVTATRIATPAEQIASSVTVVTAADIAAQDQQTLPQILENMPGLNVVQTGGPGGVTSVFMRGTNSNHVKVLVDGIDVSDPSASGDTFDFGQYLPGDIARVEVLRGPQSGLYGSDAIGGVINIITKPGAGPLQFNAAAEGGSFDTFNQTGSVSGSDSGFSYFADIQHLHAGATPVTPSYLLAPGQKRNPDYDDNLTGSTKLGYAIIDNLDLGFAGRFTNTTSKTTGDNFLTGFPETQQAVNTTNGYYARGTAHLVLFDGILDQTLGFGFTHNHSNNLDPLSGLSNFAGQRAKLDYQGNIALGEGEVLVIGADHERESIGIPLKAATTTDAGLAELQSSLGDLNSAVNVRYDSNDQFGDHATFRVAPTYLIEATGTRLKASVGTGFKAPTLADLFQNFPSFGFFANPNLKPETSTGYDAGFEQALGGSTTFGATFYYNNIRNLINDNATFTSLTNVGKAITEGVEAFAETKLSDDLSLRADYTYTDAHDADLNQVLLRRPKHKVTLDARWQAMEQLSLDANLTYVSSWVDGNRTFTISRLNAPGYALVNLSATYDLNENLALDGRISNALDQHYQNPTGFLAPSLGWYLGIKVRE
jgi:vitamin B12 transporter